MATVIAGCPIHYYKNYIMKEFIASLHNMQRKSKHDIDILLADNSPTTEYMDYIHETIDQEIPITHLKDPPSGEPNSVHKRLVECRNMIRKFAIDGDYDYFLSIECDVIAPSNTVDILVSEISDLRKAVLSGIYYSKFFSSKYTESSGPHRADAGVLGLTLIPVEILKDVKFRYPDNTLRAFDDAYFYADIHKQGWVHYVTPSVKAEHKRKNGPEYAVKVETGKPKAWHKSKFYRRQQRKHNRRRKRITTRPDRDIEKYKKWKNEKSS